jgi:pimeloyl-ACP methyl ester carboxylesterase
LLSAADQAFLTLPTKRPVYLVGESLGTGVASYLAGTYSNRIAGVLLISPFNNLVDAAQSHYPVLPVVLLLKDRFPSEKYLRHYDGKVGITVDAQDTVVPDKLSYRLLRGYAGPKRLWAFPDGGHCQITVQPSIFWKEVIDFWQTNGP